MLSLPIIKIQESTSKSSLFFSKSIPAHDREMISYVMGIPIGSGKGKYLGLPYMTGRSKKEIFQHVEEKVRKKLSGSKERFLSPGGKEVLLKSVIQVVPSYVMQCFALPKSLIDSIAKMMRGFFWSSGDSNAKIHWRAWDVCCRSKVNGGVGFRNLKHFNTALLAKQIWSLVQHPTSMVGSLLKAKYFLTTDIMEAGLGSRPSYLWRSLLVGKDLLAKGLRWRIGDGAGIQIYRDPWIPMNNTFVPAHGGHSLPRTSMVQELFVPGRKEWNIEVVQEYFLPHEADHILNIPLLSSQHKNQRIWHFDSKGKYTVKFGYSLAASLDVPPGATTGISSSSAVSQYKFIWKLPIQPRIAHFLWRAAHDCLPTTDALRKRNLSDGACGLCGEQKETLRHCLFDCHIPKGVRMVDPQFDYWAKLSSTSLIDMMLTIMEREGHYEAGYCVTLLWNIWKARCAAIFEGTPVHVTQFVSHAQIEFDGYIAAVKSSTVVQPKENITDRWTPPPPGWLKCNVDGSLKDGKAAIGGIIRDHAGNILLAFSEGLKMRFSNNPVALVEGWAIKAGMEVAYNWGASHLILEGDSQALIGRLQHEVEDYSVLGTMIEDLRGLSRCFDNIFFSFVRCIGNLPAHLLAQYGLGLSSRCMFTHDIPANVLIANATDTS